MSTECKDINKKENDTTEFAAHLSCAPGPGM